MERTFIISSYSDFRAVACLLSAYLLISLTPNTTLAQDEPAASASDDEAAATAAETPVPTEGPEDQSPDTPSEGPAEEAAEDPEESPPSGLEEASAPPANATPEPPTVLPPPPGADISQDASPAGEVPASRCLMVVDAAAIQLAPIVPTRVTEEMRRFGAELGYRVLTREQTVAAARLSQMPYPPEASHLWRTAYGVSCERFAFAKLWAHAGRYRFMVIIGSLDGTGPFMARGSGSGADLIAQVNAALREQLPPPSTWDEEGHQRVQAQFAGQVPARIASVEEPPPAPPPPIRGHRLQLAFNTEAAFGLEGEGEGFYNHFVGVRADYRVTPNAYLGLYLGYSNLEGRNQRESNLVVYTHIESRFRLRGGASRVSLPFRFGFGYVPFNGPLVRMSAGVNIQVSDEFELGFDLISPTVWVIPGDTLVSMNIGAELIYRL